MVFKPSTKQPHFLNYFSKLIKFRINCSERTYNNYITHLNGVFEIP